MKRLISILFAFYSSSLFAEPESGAGGGLLSVDGGLAFWTVVTFLILLFILKKVAWKPILTALDNRENAIKESLEKAELAKQEAQRILNENQASLAKAEEESKKIIEQSKVYADKLKEQIIQESKLQAKKLIDDAASEIDRKKDAAFQELKSHVAEIAIQAAGKLIKENLDQEKQRKLVDSYLNEIGKN
jgi:F-type H+-transporting ATPase subunit b